MRGGLVVGLYNNKEVWPLFGYKGESFSKGGYIDRGFNESRGSEGGDRMAGQFDQNDDGVVVVIGTGAGGGTLANELAQKGIEVVALEAGGVICRKTTSMTSGEASAQLAWTDKRTTSGNWQVAQ